jgi:hypothetical protein
MVANSGKNGIGVGVIEVVSSSKLRYTAPGSTVPGTAVTILNGETKALVDGADSSKWVRVTRTSASAMAGSGAIEFLPAFLNVFAMGNETAGSTIRYRAVFLRNNGAIGLEALKLAIHPFTAAVTTTGGGLPGAGAGTITGPTDAFAGWPHRGWARIHDSGGTEKEVVYYVSRTRTVLTVESAGRSCLGTSAAAGAADDTIRSVPGIRIAWENASPKVNGSVQTIASETTAPTGLSFTRAVTVATGISAGNLFQNEQGAVWIERGRGDSFVGARQDVAFDIEYKIAGTTFTETAWGYWRVADTTLDRYELHIGTNAEPDITAAPNETFTALPYNTTAGFTAGNTYYLVTNRRNRYDLVSQSVQTSIVKVAAGPVAVAPTPSTPEIISLAAAAAGTMLVKGVHYYAADTAAQQANQWLVYEKAGSAPVPGVDSPTVVTMNKTDGAAYLEHTTGAYGNGTVVYVLLRVRRSADTIDSASSATLNATASTVGPGVVDGGIFFDGVAEVL